MINEQTCEANRVIPGAAPGGSTAPSDSGLRSHRRETLAQEALSQLRNAIVMGHIPPGAPLRLQEIANQLEMSVSPVREALRQLELSGLAEHSPYRGSQVTLLTADEMEETYEIRRALESLAVRRAAVRFTAGDIAEVRATIERIDEAYAANDDTRVIRGNTDFHLSIARAARSAGLLRLLTAVCETSERYSAAVLRRGRPDEMQDIEKRGHLAIFEACCARDPLRAEAALREHLDVFAKLFQSQADLDTPREP